ncbi:hypothetical protein V6C53_16425 [Desulfocurvibacter africanus]|uniref:LEM-3-like GIY-YIG domain-containing protein n=1 Tax=Desulfocurvibacter africanus TaxID=873 RepID=UPI00054F6FEB|nr:hypothetical protein [Desulfocurvibacter africanus]
MLKELRFPPEVAEKLKCYVYRLIDPRNGETFYVGRGQGDRIFEHVRAALNVNGVTLLEDAGEDVKFERIRQIDAEGFDVHHVIHCHGLSEEQAKAVESALIDVYPGLTNKQLGAGSVEFGPKHVNQIIVKYAAEEAVFDDSCNYMLININKSIGNRPNVYECVRHAWGVERSRAEGSDYVLAVAWGIIRGVYVAERWLEATVENFPEQGASWNKEGKLNLGFEGKMANQTIWDSFVGKRVNLWRKRGAQYSVRYVDNRSRAKNAR